MACSPCNNSLLALTKALAEKRLKLNTISVGDNTGGANTFKTTKSSLKCFSKIEISFFSS